MYSSRFCGRIRAAKGACELTFGTAEGALGSAGGANKSSCAIKRPYQIMHCIAKTGGQRQFFLIRLARLLHSHSEFWTTRTGGFLFFGIVLGRAAAFKLNIEQSVICREDF
jgi:hypothetical protein